MAIENFYEMLDRIARHLLQDDIYMIYYNSSEGLCAYSFTHDKRDIQALVNNAFRDGTRYTISSVYDASKLDDYNEIIEDFSDFHAPEYVFSDANIIAFDIDVMS